jgi:hypothetical protein
MAGEPTGLRMFGFQRLDVYAIARGSALECAAILDAFGALGFVQDSDLTEPLELLERIVSMLTRMARG